MRIWNFGIVGAGMVAWTHARALQDLENAKLIGVCDNGSGRGQKLADNFSCHCFANYQQLVQSPEIDIVLIASPSGAHMEPTVAAAKNGKHVLCEKPLEVTLARIDRMIAAHEQAGTRLGGIFQNRFHDAIPVLRRAAQSGRLGTITFAGVYIPWWRDDAYYQDSWRGTWRLDGGGALMNQSIHMVELLCDLAPPVAAVQAFTTHLGHPQIEAEDTAVAILQFVTGAVGLIYGSTAAYPGQARRLEITGTRGSIVYSENRLLTWQFADPLPEDAKIRQQFGFSTENEGAANPAAIAHENHKRNILAFLSALETGAPFEIDVRTARKPVELILAIYQAAREQKAIKLVQDQMV